MRQFLTIFKFEFIQLIKAKAYIITTLLFCSVAIVGLSLPLVFPDMTKSEDIENTFEKNETFAIYDENNILNNDELFTVYFPNVKMKYMENEKEVKEAVKSKNVEAGFVLNNDLYFDYYVYNSDVMDMRPMIFSKYLNVNYQHNAMQSLGINEEESMMISSAQSNYESHTIGSDGANNISYVFVMIMVIYMVIIMYGNIIATSVASEKGNRTMELLVTSASSTSLIFAKVLAGCLAATLQIALFASSAMVTYHFSEKAWNGMLDIIFNIPTDVLLAFIAFGLLGFIFYSFMFGTVGALVSKSEDVNSSSTPITLIFIVVYFLVFIGVTDSSSPLFTVASFVPFSSPMAMFARMAMVDVPMIEIIISLSILVVSTGFVGYAAAKIYRRATLMYGNQIKLSHAFKWLNKKDI